jgi:hypothetical protein
MRAMALVVGSIEIDWFGPLFRVESSIESKQGSAVIP